MTHRLASMLGRGSRLRRRLTLAVLSVIVLLGAATALAPPPRPKHRSVPRAPGPTPSVEVPTVPHRPFVSPSELAHARRVAARFLAGYLPFLYGRASARSITGAMRGLRRKLTRTRMLDTPVERRRHPRVISLTTAGGAPGTVLATALVEDGGVTTYALRVTLRREPAGWRVSGANGG